MIFFSCRGRVLFRGGGGSFCGLVHLRVCHQIRRSPAETQVRIISLLSAKVIVSQSDK
jgi:hypothetical protein